MFKFRFSALLTFAAVILSVSSASATVIFSTLPFGSGGLGVVGPTNTDTVYQELAAQFTPTQSATLTSIDVAFSHFRGNNDAVTFALYSSVNNLPGSVLGTSSLAAGTLTATSALYNLAFGNISLLAGTSYFLDAYTTTSSWQSWAPSTTATLVPAAQTGSRGGTFISIANRSLAFQVNGTVSTTATPEPGTAVLLLSAGLALATFARRRSTR